MTIERRAAALLFLVFTACQMPNTNTNREVPAPEVIFAGGTVLAGPKQTPQVNWSVVTANGLIVDVGPTDAIRTAHPEARVIDVHGTTVMPGMTDAHGHLYGLGLSLDTVNVVGAPSFQDVVARVRERAQRAAPGEWILGRGWDQNRWADKQFPTAAPLDATITDHPVWIRRVDGHAGVANSAAMRAVGVTAATPDPEGGRILRDPSGRPTGVFIDGAQQLIDSKVPQPSAQLRKARLLEAARKVAENGLTEMHDAGAEQATITAIRELIDEHKFPIRVYLMLTDEAELLNSWLTHKPLIGYGGRLTVRSVKMYADGALGSRGAAMLAPYSDDPTNTGLLVSKPEHMLAVARRARAAGYQVNTHAIGDRGVRNVIDAYEQAGAKPADRFRVEHFQVVAPSDFARLAQHGIIASMQPTHATSDMPWAEARVGPERIKGAYAWRTVLNSGARLALGSDFPVEDVNPFFGLYSAVTRQDQQGNPAGGWYPDQKLTLAEAIRGFTSDAAYAAFEESSRGTIEPGKLADLTIVEGDLYVMPPSQLFSTKVRYTVVGGEVVYQNAR
ncbi:MAG TPA: amidohydrolase [Thermoanaerobaculia bacterium]|jgi:predicted amidohydrolase YtcJ|nr:amidohydrolase [Thermoanaerobaculia bacterium]